jgi:hypothetical protein
MACHCPDRKKLYHWWKYTTLRYYWRAVDIALQNVLEPFWMYSFSPSMTRDEWEHWFMSEPEVLMEAEEMLMRSSISR